MKVAELYSAIAVILAKNFNDVIDINDVLQVRKSEKWIISSDNEANVKGNDEYKKFIEKESIAVISDDFVALKSAFEVDHFVQGGGEDLGKFYKAIGFEPKLGQNGSVSNQLLFIATMLRNDLDDQKGELLRQFIMKFFLPYAKILADDIISRASSHFYKAMGYFLKDFYENLMQVFGIKEK
ncbi:MAG: hypothetical protein K5978_02045 [Campylobacter sp.]|nr:hypothetical protein [Campylobacter sp.]